ncbi:hypothetical protein [Streptacidiphilus sp. MAP5-3]|uniref:hypothetical protein n=1 Tax=unclassified Streptacidiphilus TaxID=2643834 RepID=UPI003518CA89
MEARHGPALSWRERRALTDIEQELREDEKLEQALRTMRPPRRVHLPSLHRRHQEGNGGAGV